ncbi:short-chain dehydrogenase/reductase SDR [Desulfovibrio sp. X2]|uniref:SDR family oxidoreductase n=1 Tax=Desulfovibrio sp. X2 TaxID=941449 RepID=UPI000358B9C6|nr:SDR family oxidoreductase [Desulfovibrio sp. X2]EPR42124.1 short-chain dehydrogenase/reductase SDR [Desulfovibrio sp. X2]
MTASSRKTAIVTGSSRGIGREVALRLARDGFAVTVNYARSADEADKVVAAIEAAGGKAVALQADVSDFAAATRLFDETEKAFGGVDVLVNNAGIINLAPVEKLRPDVFARIIAVNLTGTYNMLHLAAARLRENGRIVNFSTTALHTSLPGYAAYNASKAAVEAMTRVLSKELGPRGITVNAVAPGPVATELFFEDKSQELIDRLVSLTPLARLGEPTDIAPVVSFLAGPESAWVTGQVLRANGGLG